MPITAGLGTAIAAGIGGLTTGASAVIQSRSAGKAREEAYRANKEAVAYETKKQAEAKALSDRQRDAYRTAWNAWAARAGPEGIKRYGVPVGMSYNPTGAPGTGPSGGTPEPTPNPASAPYGVDPNAPAPAATGALGPFASAAAGMSPAPTPQRAGTLGQLMGAGAPVPTPGGMGIQPGPAAAPMQAAPAAPVPLPAQATPPQGTIGEMAGWNDWNRYGLGA